MKLWLGDEFPQNHTAFFYDKKLKMMIQLDENDIFYLAPIFNSISLESQSIGVQPSSFNDDPYFELYISAGNSNISPLLTPETFAENFQQQLDNIIEKNMNSTLMNDFIQLEESSLQTLVDLLADDMVDKDFFNLNYNKSSTADQHISPITSIQSQLTDHLRMETDVHPTPARRNYLSNMGRTSNSCLAYLSGIKGPNERGKQIRPIVIIPFIVLQWLQEIDSLDLVVACVRETQENGTHVWWIDKHSEFRTKGYTKETPGVNPLELSLTLKAIKNGNFKLEVILNRIPGKINTQRKGELFHSLDDVIANQLHPALHDPNSSRLALVISTHGMRQWNTIGLSNFIQEPKCKKSTRSVQSQAASEQHTAQVQSQIPAIVASEIDDSNRNLNVT
ncbi:unnamed protein product [Rotaria sordida]|uniref:Uncharacterized protein n=1 Tax=Rotaria sordida TaxID=392033 RepID=A0A814JX95_9BILA|nr:unnamed protein product [Rotaria sordida]CAF1043395.1 unnamed protein product [Rotaria sordida]